MENTTTDATPAEIKNNRTEIEQVFVYLLKLLINENT